MRPWSPVQHTSCDIFAVRLCFRCNFDLLPACILFHFVFYFWLHKMPKMPKKGSKKASKDHEKETLVKNPNDDNDIENESVESDGRYCEYSNSKESAKGLEPATFTADQEQTLVEFFCEHPEFYNKTDPNYSNRVFREKQLEPVTKSLNVASDKLITWFKNQRTAVGKLYKKKSGQGAETLTIRKQWQLKNFQFLKEHIVPRTYTKDTGKLPQPLSETQANVSVSQTESDGEEEDQPNQATASSSATDHCDQTKQKRGGGAKRKRLDDLVMDMMSKPRPTEEFTKKLESLLSSPKDERGAFGQWLLARMAKVPEERWEDFQQACFQFMHQWTQPPPQQQQWMPWVQQQQWMQQQPQQQHPQPTYQSASSFPARQCNQQSHLFHSTPTTQDAMLAPMQASTGSDVSFGSMGLSSSFLERLRSSEPTTRPSISADQQAQGQGDQSESENSDDTGN